MTQFPSKSFSVRPATMEDARAIVDLINACSMERGSRERDTEQNIRSMMKMPGLNLEADTLLAIDQLDRVVGCALVQDNPPNTLLSALTEVHPQHRWEGVGTALCRWIEERARQAIPGLPADAWVAVLQKRSSDDRAFHDLLRKQDYQVVRYNFGMIIEMDHPPSQPTMPEGILLRPFIREEEDRALIQTIREAFRDNWGYIERPFDLEVER
jgi:mycothiol synthase